MFLLFSIPVSSPLGANGGHTLLTEPLAHTPGFRVTGCEVPDISTDAHRMGVSPVAGTPCGWTERE